VKNVTTMRSGVEYMIELARWYIELTAQSSLGFFQIGNDPEYQPLKALRQRVAESEIVAVACTSCVLVRDGEARTGRQGTVPYAGQVNLLVIFFRAE